MALTFGEKIKESRKAQKLTQKQLAKLIGAAHNSISDWENNKNKPDPDTIELLCGVLKITPNYLLASSEDDFSPKEKAIIRKYRFISKYSADYVNVVDHALDKGYSIAEHIQEQQERIHALELERQKISEKLQSMRIYTYFGEIACAGPGFYFDEIPTETMEAPDMGGDFIIGVNGDSMEPDYHNGDKLYVKKTEYISHGDVGIFTIGNECFLKEYGEEGLISRNKDYGDIQGTEDVRLIGKVIGKVKE